MNKTIPHIENIEEFEEYFNKYICYHNNIIYDIRFGVVSKASILPNGITYIKSVLLDLFCRVNISITYYLITEKTTEMKNRIENAHRNYLQLQEYYMHLIVNPIEHAMKDESPLNDKEKIPTKRITTSYPIRTSLIFLTVLNHSGLIDGVIANYNPSRDGFAPANAASIISNSIIHNNYKGKTLEQYRNTIRQCVSGNEEIIKETAKQIFDSKEWKTIMDILNKA